LGTVLFVDKWSQTEGRAFSAGELVLMLFGLALLAFGVGAGLEWTGLGWWLVPVATVLIGFAFALALARGRGPAVTRPAVTIDPAEALPTLRPRPRAAQRRPQAAYYLGVLGGAAIALSLGALVMLALPGEVSALALLALGVLTWTAVVVLSFRMQLRR
jgi:hypothetical protein